MDGGSKPAWTQANITYTNKFLLKITKRSDVLYMCVTSKSDLSSSAESFWHFHWWNTYGRNISSKYGGGDGRFPWSNCGWI